MSCLDSDSETSSIATSTYSSLHTPIRARSRFTAPVSYQFGTQSFYNSKFEAITNRYLEISNFIRCPISTVAITEELEKLKTRLPKESAQAGIPIVYDFESIQLTDDDRKLSADLNTDEEEIGNNAGGRSIDDLVEKCHGTTISASIPADKHAYLEFSAPSEEVKSRLDRMLLENQRVSLSSKLRLGDDIEKRFEIAPFRVSRRQQKKRRAASRESTLKQWFDLPRVTEISKEQSKDLTALSMRRVWNAKQFYKKNSGFQGGGEENGKYFQVGTVVDSRADFFSADRIAKKARRKNIVDELLRDQELHAFNKRKLHYAMAKNSRLRLLMQRAKQRRAKKNIRLRKEAKIAHKYGATPKAVNVFKTYEL